jgi:hypothetical protein
VPDFREIRQIRACREVTVLTDGAAGPPVDAGRGAGHELLVDQVPAQRAVIVEDPPEEAVGVSSIVGQYDAGAADLASEIPQAVPFRGGTL